MDRDGVRSEASPVSGCNIRQGHCLHVKPAPVTRYQRRSVEKAGRDEALHYKTVVYSLEVRENELITSQSDAVIGYELPKSADPKIFCKEEAVPVEIQFKERRTYSYLQLCLFQRGREQLAVVIL